MRVLHVCDRLSKAESRDRDLRDLIADQVLRHRVTIAYGKLHQGRIPAGTTARQVRGLAGTIGSHAGLEDLPALLAEAQVVHLHTVRNPIAVEQVRAHPGCVTVDPGADWGEAYAALSPRPPG